MGEAFMTPRHMLAFDLGAGSGRAVLGTLTDERLHIKELHRFLNRPVELAGHLHWDFVRLFSEMQNGLNACAVEIGGKLESMAIDTWGVDYALLANDGSVLGQPFAYRDKRTDRAMEMFFAVVPRERVYALTGIQFMQLNTLFQLFAMLQQTPRLLAAASDLLFTPDFYNYLFTGEKKTEYTIATTSQMFNHRLNSWDPELLRALRLPAGVMKEIVEPGTVLGRLEDPIAKELGLPRVPVVATASHDTASAVAAVPAEGSDWAYISSGTWSLMGIEISQPIISEAALQCNFTNEGGVGRSIRFLKNIGGLWLLQECKRIWEKQRTVSYDELIGAAAVAVPFKTLIDPDAPDFLNPADMPAAISGFAARTGQPAPASQGEFVRSILEGLALKYRFVLDQLRTLTPQPVNRIHIIGGGSQNRLLCQFAADATGLPVIAGPVEATAMGNLMVQALGLGFVKSVTELRRTIRASSEVTEYTPADGARWNEAYGRYCATVLQHDAG
jgi:rhamnulokinase